MLRALACHGVQWRMRTDPSTGVVGAVGYRQGERGASLRSAETTSSLPMHVLPMCTQAIRPRCTRHYLQCSKPL